MMRAWICGLVLFAAWLGLVPASHATTLQGPADAPGFELPEGMVPCEQPEGGWRLNGRIVQPPKGAEPGTEGRLLVASEGACGPKAAVVHLLVTGPTPELDPASVTLSLAAGQLEFHGQRLAGLRIRWRTKQGLKTDACNNVTRKDGTETCTVPVGKEHATDPV